LCKCGKANCNHAARELAKCNDETTQEVYGANKANLKVGVVY